jgi:hypothetical protein
VAASSSAVPPPPSRAAGRKAFWTDFAREALVMYGLFLVYKAVRLVSAGEMSSATDHAQQVIGFERHLGFFSEPAFQRLVTEHGEDLPKLLNVYYATAHFAIMVTALIWLFCRHRAHYVRVRRLLLGLTGIALVIHLAYPLAPPRMLPSFGFVDTGMLFGPSVYDSGVLHGVANEVAAMPSLHFGWAVLVAWAVMTTPGIKSHVSILLHPVLTLAAIVGTANHYWLDAMVGFFLLVIVMQVESWFRRPRADALMFERVVFRPSSSTVPARSSPRRPAVLGPSGDQLTLTSSGMRSPMRANGPPWRRSTSRHSDCGAPVNGSPRSASNTIQAFASSSSSSCPGPHPA